MVVGAHQLVAHRHLYQLVYLSGIDQMVTTQNGLVLHNWRRSIVEVIQIYQTAALDVDETSLAQCLSDIGIVRRNLYFHGVVARRFECTLRRLAVGQQTAHGNDRQNADGQTEQSRDGCGEDVHGLARLLLVESANDEVGRRTDKGTDTAHT